MSDDDAVTLGEMRVFGDWPHAAPIGLDVIDVPLNELCVYCADPIEAVDFGYVFVDGSPTHAGCMMAHVVGHSYGVCGCNGWTYKGRAAGDEVWRRVSGEAQRFLRTTNGTTPT